MRRRTVEFSMPELIVACYPVTGCHDDQCQLGNRLKPMVYYGVCYGQGLHSDYPIEGSNTVAGTASDRTSAKAVTDATSQTPV